MKNKAPLALMEQLVMILVFALAAALCLQMFVLSDSTSVSGEKRDYAVTAVQNAAEALKLSRGSYDEMTQLLGGEATKDGWRMGFDDAWRAAPDGKAAYTVTAQEIEDGDDLLGSAIVAAYEAGGGQLFEVTVCWQEDRNE